MKPLLTLAILLTIPATASADCRVLYRQQQQAYYVRPYVVQQFAYPQVYYAVGDSLRLEALAEKVADKVALRLTQSQQQPAPIKATVLSARCSKCHSGDSAKGGVILDGSEPINAEQFRRIVEMVGLNRDVPEAMKGVMAGLKVEDKGAITEELLNLKGDLE